MPEWQQVQARNKAAVDGDVRAANTVHWHSTLIHAALTCHMGVLLWLLCRAMPSQLAVGQACLLLAAIFVCVRHRFTRLFSLLATVVGTTALVHGLLECGVLYTQAIALGAATTATGLHTLAQLRSRALAQVGLLVCFCLVQVANLTLYISGLPLSSQRDWALVKKYSADDDDDDDDDYYNSTMDIEHV
ncbi:LANO_0H03048g1_1 [Lachancea nothofagi CBS 11611]|uniref:LANO_0H03048g1_1 n=1 Tax=Lachancea nothofagi CBS 11611 TaxID=1266666 RepID=A0A1G4KLE6_9SACH|nr:LANO_0H03048g1_1 [Lachancea nothofagi CBS 11611]